MPRKKSKTQSEQGSLDLFFDDKGAISYSFKYKDGMIEATVIYRGNYNQQCIEFKLGAGTIKEQLIDSQSGSTLADYEYDQRNEKRMYARLKSELIYIAELILRKQEFVRDYGDGIDSSITTPHKHAVEQLFRALSKK